VGFEQAGQFVAESRTGLIGVLGRDGRLHEAPRRAGNRMTRGARRVGSGPRRARWGDWVSPYGGGSGERIGRWREGG
jgi:hypothetical protein